MMDRDGLTREARLLGGGSRRRDDRDDEGLAPSPPVVRVPGKGGRFDADEGLGFRGPVDRRAAGGAPDRARAGAAAALIATQPGEPLPAALVAQFSRELGVDLAGVRIHTDARAAQAAALLAARAFTVGHDVYFASGAYAPDDASGLELLAHELAHVAQNLRGAHADRRQVSTPDQAHEREAEAFARRPRRSPMARGDAAGVAARLGALGLRVDDADLGWLAASYGDGLALSQGRLAGDDGAAHLARLIEHARDHACERGCAHAPAPPRIERLDPATRATVERTTGVALPEIQVELDATMSAAGRLAEAVGAVIRIAPGVPGADHPEGRRVRMHEAVHVAQQQVRDAAPPRDRTAAVEAEAHAAVDAAEQGRPAALHTQAEPTTAYGFGVGDVVSAVSSATGVDPIQWLLDHVPAIGTLRSGGLTPFLARIGEAAGGALGPIFDGLDPARLAGTVTDLFAPLGAGKLAFGVLTGCCECFGEALQKMVTAFEGFLAGDRAQSLRAWFDGLQQGVIDSLLGEMTDMFAALRRWGQPLVALIDAVSAGIDLARSVIGDLADQAWREVICPPLGLDPTLPPRQAIEKKLAELWAPIQAAIDTVRRGIDALWQKLKANPIVAKILKVVDDCRRLWRAIQLCRDAQTRDPQKWLTILATETRGTIFEGLIAALQQGHDAAIDTRDAAVNWVLQVLDDLGVLGAWNSAVPVLQQIGQAILGFVGAVRTAITTVRDAIAGALTGLATAATKLWDAARPLLNFALGFALAASALATGNPLPMITFLASQAFLALPACHKEAIADAVLDLFIAFVEFVPARLPPIVIIKGAALGFLRTLRGAPAAQKIAAMDNIARMISFDVEMMAGFVVGVVEGLWASALGLIVRIAIWPMRQIIDAVVGVAQQAAELAGRTFASTLDALDWLGEALSGATPLPAPGTYAGGPLGGGDPPGGGGGPRTDVRVIGRDETPPVTPAAGGGGDDGAGFEAAPAFPELADPVELFNHIFRRGVTREDLEALLTKFNAGLDAVAGRAGEQAATRLIEFFANRSTPYRVGEVLGEIVGWIAGELIVIAATVGIGAAVLEGARGAALLAEIGMNFPRLVEALNAMRTALQPLLRVVAQWGDDFVRLFRSVMTWLDDMARWAERQFVRLLNWIANNPRAAWRWYRRLRRLWGAITDDDDAQLRELAEEAAGEGWDYLMANMAAEVKDEPGVRALLLAVNVVRRRSVDIHLQVHHTSERGWAVRATASSDGEAVSADVGDGWITMADPAEPQAGQPFYATADHEAEHVALIDEVIERLLRGAERERAGGGALADVYQRIVAMMTEEQRRGQDRLHLAGVRFSITPEGLADVEADHDILTRLLISPNASSRFAHIPTGQAAWLGAEKGPPGIFHGSFDTGVTVGGTAWDWAGYPTGAITTHPANAFLRYRTATALDQLKPPDIAYNFVGGSTPGGAHVDEWRDHLTDEIETKINDLMAADPTLTRADAEDRAKAAVLTRYQATYPGILDLKDLELRGSRQWQAHHIHEHSWGGGGARNNFQYLLRTGEHQELSNWWNTRRDEIKHALSI